MCQHRLAVVCTLQQYYHQFPLANVVCALTMKSCYTTREAFIAFIAHLALSWLQLLHGQARDEEKGFDIREEMQNGGGEG